MNTDTIYVEGSLIFFTPDGVGKVFFDSIEEAKDQTGIDRVVSVPRGWFCDFVPYGSED